MFFLSGHKLSHPVYPQVGYMDIMQRSVHTQLGRDVQYSFCLKGWGTVLEGCPGSLGCPGVEWHFPFWQVTYRVRKQSIWDGGCLLVNTNHFLHFFETGVNWHQVKERRFVIFDNPCRVKKIGVKGEEHTPVQEMLSRFLCTWLCTNMCYIYLFSVSLQPDPRGGNMKVTEFIYLLLLLFSPWRPKVAYIVLLSSSFILTTTTQWSRLGWESVIPPASLHGMNGYSNSAFSPLTLPRTELQSKDLASYLKKPAMAQQSILFSHVSE